MKKSTDIAGKGVLHSRTAYLARLLLIKKSDRRQPFNYWFIFCPLLVAIYIFVVSYLTPMIADDLQIAAQAEGRFFDPALIIKLFKENYFSHGGRSSYIWWIAMATSFGRMPFHEYTANIIPAALNGLFFVGLLWAMFVMAFGRAPLFSDRGDRWRWWLFFVASMVLLARKGETVFWLTGYTVYSWSLLLLLLFLLPYRLSWLGSPVVDDWQKKWQGVGLLLFLPLAFLAGMSFELAGALVIALLLLGFAYHRWWSRSPQPFWVYAGFVFFIVGYVMMMIAPGNYVRLQDPFFDKFNNSSFFDKLLNMPHAWVYFLNKSRWVALLLPPLWFWWWRLWKGAAKDEAWRLSIFFWLVSFAYASSIAFSPILAGRVFFFSSAAFLLSLILVLDFLFWRDGYKLLFRRSPIDWQKITAALLVLVGVVQCTRILLVTLQYHVAFQGRAAIIKEQKDRGVVDIIVPPMQVNGKQFKSNFWVNDGHIPVSWLNDAWAGYYRVRSFREE